MLSFSDAPLLWPHSKPASQRTSAPAADRQPARPEGDTLLLTTPQLIEQIMRLNPTASSTYLQQFGRLELAHYLEHLLACERPRGRDAIWERRHETAAILMAEPAL